MPKSLLLADDSTTIRTAVGMVFKKEDFTLTTVANGTEALDRARDLKPDIIVADVDMPGLSGYELCEKVRSDAALKQTPVLLLGGGSPVDPSRAIAVGANGQMAKPFESQKLIDQVKQILADPKPMAGGIQPGAGPAARPSAPPPGVAGPRPSAPPPARPAPPPPQASKPPPVARPPGAPPTGGPPRTAGAPPPAGAKPPPRPPTAPPPPGARPAPGAPPRPSASPPAAGARPPASQPPRAPPSPPGAARPAAPRPGPPPPGGRPPPPAAARPPAPSPPQAMSAEVEEEILLDEDLGEEAPPGPPLRAVPSPGGKPPLSVVPPAKERRASADGGEAALREALSKASREVIEKIAWEVVPELAETIIREELERLMKERGQ